MRGGGHCGGRLLLLLLVHQILRKGLRMACVLGSWMGRRLHARHSILVRYVRLKGRLALGANGQVWRQRLQAALVRLALSGVRLRAAQLRLGRRLVDARIGV